MGNIPKKSQIHLTVGDFGAPFRKKTQKGKDAYDKMTRPLHLLKRYINETVKPRVIFVAPPH